MCKEVNIFSWDEISSRLADPELKLHPEMKHYFSPYNHNFSFVLGLKQKIPFIQKIIFIKIKIF